LFSTKFAALSLAHDPQNKSNVYLGAFTRERIAEAAVGFCIDLMFQATIKYWFAPEGQDITVMESVQGLDYIQASASAIEALISTEGWRGLLGSVV